MSRGKKTNPLAAMPARRGNFAPVKPLATTIEATPKVTDFVDRAIKHPNFDVPVAASLTALLTYLQKEPVEDVLNWLKDLRDQNGGGRQNPALALGLAFVILHEIWYQGEDASDRIGFSHKELLKLKREVSPYAQEIKAAFYQHFKKELQHLSFESKINATYIYR